MKKKLKPRTQGFNKDKHYVNNEKLLNEIILHKEEVKKWKENGSLGEKPRVNDYIGLCILNTANKFASKSKFNNWPYTDEMIADGIENCLRYICNFNENKSKNPFSYFTQIIYYAFLRRIQKETKQQYTKYKAIEDLRLHCDDFDIKNMVDNFGTEDFDCHMQDFMVTYEKYNNVPRDRKKKKSDDILNFLSLFI